VTDDEPQERNWFKGSLAIFLMLLKGLLLPLSLGLITLAFTWPISYYSCMSYSDAIQHPSKFQFFKCYLQADDGRWLERTEYESSEIGIRLIIAQPIETKLK